MAEPLHFHKSLYAKQGIEAAAEAYAQLAEFVIGEEGQDFTVVINAHDPANTDAIVDHFANHALFASLACQADGP